MVDDLDRGRQLWGSIPIINRSHVLLPPVL
jgi:hypothetical protein